MGLKEGRGLREGTIKEGRGLRGYSPTGWNSPKGTFRESPRDENLKEQNPKERMSQRQSLRKENIVKGEGNL